MKNFERQLSELPKPDVEVAAFKRRLRNDLLHARAGRAERRPRWALGLASTAAAACALLLVLFVLSPSVPARVHAALTGDGRQPLNDEIPLRELLRRTEASAELDLAFIEDWSTQQAMPVQVRSMEAEKIYAVRQFELTNGKRMIVFTELGPESGERRVAQTPKSRQVL